MSEQKFCKYCGKPLINGECTCDEFQKHKAHQEKENNKPNDGEFSNSQSNGAGNSNDSTYQNQGPTDENTNGRNEKEKILEDIEKKATAFFGVGKDSYGTEEPDRDFYEHNIPIAPDCIQPEKDEVMVRQYNIALLRTRIKFMKAEGRLEVTNKRILFRAAGKGLKGPIVQEHQFKLDEIGGIEIHNDYKFSLLNFFLFILLALFLISLSTGLIGSIALFGAMDGGRNFGSNNTINTIISFIFSIIAFLGSVYLKKYNFISNLLAVFAAALMTTAAKMSQYGILNFISVIAWIYLIVLLFINSMVPNLVIKIKTKGASGALVIGSQKAIFRRKSGDDYSGFSEVMPWEDTEQAINELGTMIDDLQQQGNYALEKWTK